MNAGQQAYELDLLNRPNYEDGSKRKSWENLSDVAKWSWNKNPTPIDYGNTNEKQNIKPKCF